MVAYKTKGVYLLFIFSDNEQDGAESGRED